MPYSIKLDKNGYYTGSYATIGGIEDGIGVDSLPPETDLIKILCYRWLNGWVFDQDKYNSVKSEYLDNAKQLKTGELNLCNQQAIYFGIDVNTTVGLEHFSMTDADQKNIKNAYDIVKKTYLPISYHADKTPIRSFTPVEISDIYMEAQMHIMYCNTLCNVLNTWVRRCETEDEISTISYKSTLPDDLKCILDQNGETIRQAITALLV